MQTPSRAGMVADARQGNWVDRFAPEWLRPYARLARWDRPIGSWLLFWPCGFSLALAAVKVPGAGFNWWALALCWLGAVAMRGAGCTLNDIVDADIDARVDRTRSRPIPSGQVSRAQAGVFLVAQAVAGLLILLQFNPLTWAVGAASLALIVIYPFMKRITWWPQFFLGLAFAWGALLGWSAEVQAIGLPAILLYVGTICWVIGYDTIYALQDIEDDALIGVKSTARLFGSQVRPAVAVFYTAAMVLWAGAALLVGAGPVFLLGALAPAALLAWQLLTLDAEVPRNAQFRFWMNGWVGFALTAALLLEAWV